MTKYVIFKYNKHDASVSTVTVEGVFPTKELAHERLLQITTDLIRLNPSCVVTKSNTKVSCDAFSHYYKIKKVNYDLFPSVFPDEHNNNYAYFGDESVLKLPENNRVLVETLDNNGVFDELEDECWELIKSYIAAFDCNLTDEDCISFDLAKQLQNYIIEMFVAAGVQFCDKDHNVIF